MFLRKKKWEAEEEAISKGKKILILIRSSNVLKWYIYYTEG